MKIHALVIAVGVALVGCQQQTSDAPPAEAPAAEPAAAPQPSAAPPVAQAAAPAAAEVPTPEDFEEEAARDINEGNAAAELSKLETEIEAK